MQTWHEDLNFAWHPGPFTDANGFVKLTGSYTQATLPKTMQQWICESLMWFNHR